MVKLILSFSKNMKMEEERIHDRSLHDDLTELGMLAVEDAPSREIFSKVREILANHPEEITSEQLMSFLSIYRKQNGNNHHTPHHPFKTLARFVEKGLGPFALAGLIESLCRADDTLDPQVLGAYARKIREICYNGEK